MMRLDNKDTAGGSPFVIEEGGTDRGEPVTRVPAQPPFFYVAYPESWGVIGGHVLPILRKLKIQGGLSGIGSSRQGKPTGIALAKARQEGRGRTVIPLDSVPPQHIADGEAATYLYRPEGRGNVCLPIYELCYPGSTRTDCDEPRWIEFLQYQITSGLIKPCPAYVLERMRDDEAKKAGKESDKARTVPSRAVAAAAHAANVAAIDAELESRTAAQKPSRRRKVASVGDES